VGNWRRSWNRWKLVDGVGVVAERRPAMLGGTGHRMATVGRGIIGEASERESKARKRGEGERRSCIR